jgi:hypothetical protein
LSVNELTGTLPSKLFDNHAALEYLNVRPGSICLQQPVAEACGCLGKALNNCPCLNTPACPEFICGTSLPCRLLQLEINLLSGSLPERWGASHVRRRNCMHMQRHCMSLPLPVSLHLQPVIHGCILRPNLHVWLQAKNLVLGFNGLAGPAFPPAWLQAGAMPRLEDLALSHTGLTGTLPTNLTWPNLASL